MTSAASCSRAAKAGSRGGPGRGHHRVARARLRGVDQGAPRVPVIQDLRTRADALRRRELDRALKQLARGDAPEAVIEQLSQALTNKFLHDPMSTLRDAGDEAEAARVQALLARFYSSDH